MGVIRCDIHTHYFGAEMTTGIDAVFIADCDGGGGDHLELARPFLTKGIPTFVDKLFASKLADAKAIIRLANKHATPLNRSSTHRTPA